MAEPFPADPAESALCAFLRQRQGQRFVWGVSDCCLFAADWVYHATGLDPAAGLRGTYSTERGARAALRRLGGLRAVASMASWPEAEAVPGARPGDLAVIGEGRNAVLAVNAAPRAWYYQGPGLALVVDPPVWARWEAPRCPK